MSNEKTLLDQIDDLVASKTFNLDALDGIKAIKDELKHTLSNLEAKTQMLDLKREENLALREEIRRKQERIEELQTQVSSMNELATKGTAAIWEKKIADASAAAYKDALYTVFKPSAVRETVQRHVAKPVEGHPGGNGSYPTAGYLATAEEHETTTREDA